MRKIIVSCSPSVRNSLEDFSVFCIFFENSLITPLLKKRSSPLLSSVLRKYLLGAFENAAKCSQD